jgi:hypothetical protein
VAKQSRPTSSPERGNANELVQTKSDFAAAPDGEITIDEFLTYLAPACWRGKASPPPIWPPDAFAITASLLHRTGAYRRVGRSWPPMMGEDYAGMSWADAMFCIGGEWRRTWSEAKVPDDVVRWWRILRTARGKRLSEVSEDDSLCEALLQICAAADEACIGIGAPQSFTDLDDGESGKSETSDVHGLGNDLRAAYEKFFRFAEKKLNREWSLDHSHNQPDRYGSTLCDQIHPSRVRILPKRRTCPSGIPVRSITHSLALCPANEVACSWRMGGPGFKAPESRFLNLLLVPWPFRVLPTQFRELTIPDLREMPKEFGLFTYDGQHSSDVRKTLNSLLEQSRRLVGNIDGVIFPEAALTQWEHNALRNKILPPDCFLIAGLHDARPNALGRNYVECTFPLDGVATVKFQQQKHHRWRLERQQIIRYGLSSQLNPGTQWWEGIEISDRKLTFVALQEWLTLCALVCEDLARPDPVAEIIRSVGPNLVVALLQDGPQFKSRWQAHYAAVLADDPGSSVLTLTNLGMAELSRELQDQKSSRVVALWKDAKSPAIEIHLPPDAQGVILNVAIETQTDWTGDGRSSGMERRALLTLGGIHPVSATT